MGKVENSMGKYVGKRTPRKHSIKSSNRVPPSSVVQVLNFTENVGQGAVDWNCSNDQTESVG